MKLGKIIHLGIVVEDLEKAVKIYEETLGIGPWEIQDAREFFAQMRVNGGHGLEIRTAMFHGDGYEIELITPTGEGVYADWLREKGPGLHHVKFDTADSYQTITGEAEKISGRPPYLNVEWPDGRPLVAYADLLKEAGLLIEVSGGEEA
ncbi:MAG TPA: VOC family protein [Candidatus Mediterraneibacter faecavium]|uniref:VOC family protein n=1 Tax=Candidatus Mediterraneibacter faecavium TaxID=2838668 RepID=A0A9D2Q8Y3_9FIRM|nr:VOC family protein [Candidatus Mediterraneibacter faecavium]